MQRSDMIELFDRYQRIEIDIPGMRKDVFPGLVRFIRPAPGSSLVSYSRLDPADADTQIDAQMAYFMENKLPFCWKVYAHDAPADLVERLALHGMEVSDLDDVMVLDLQDVPASLLRPPQDLVQAEIGAEIRVISLPEQLGDVERVLNAVWGGSYAWIHQRMGSHLQIPGYLYITAAYAGGQPVSVGWVYFNPNNPFAKLFGGSTLLDQRGRGLYSALLAARVQEALRRGCRFLTVDAGPMSAPIVRRHGFERITQFQDCDWEPAPAENAGN